MADKTQTQYGIPAITVGGQKIHPLRILRTLLGMAIVVTFIVKAIKGETDIVLIGAGVLLIDPTLYRTLKGAKNGNGV